MQTYSSCSLIKQEDKLVALSEIARALKRVTNHRYICGMWEEFLPQSLAWSVVSRARMTETPIYLAPSWCWAALNANCKMFPGRHLALAKVQACHLDYRTEDEFGIVDDGYLDLKGNLNKFQKVSFLCKPSGLFS